MKYLKTYIGSNYSGGDHIFKLLYKLRIINLPKQTKPISPADEFETEICKHEIKTYAKQRDHMREGLKKTHHLI